MSDLPVNRMATPESDFDRPAFLTVLSCLVLFQWKGIVFLMAHAVYIILEIFGYDFR